MKYIIKPITDEILYALDTKVEEFQRDITLNTGRIVDVEVSGTTVIVRAPFLIGIRGTHCWHTNRYTLDEFFLPYSAPAIKLDEELFTL